MSDPDAIKNLLDPKLLSKSKKPKDEEYLSFSETSDDYEYYFMKVKKGKGE